MKAKMRKPISIRIGGATQRQEEFQKYYKLIRLIARIDPSKANLFVQVATSRGLLCQDLTKETLFIPPAADIASLTNLSCPPVLILEWWGARTT